MLSVMDLFEIKLVKNFAYTVQVSLVSAREQTNKDRFVKRRCKASKASKASKGSTAVVRNQIVQKNMSN